MYIKTNQRYLLMTSFDCTPRKIAKLFLYLKKYQNFQKGLP